MDKLTKDDEKRTMIARDSTDPLVSVIMPVYNQETFVSDAINSILDQTFADFEFIIVDDGSTDKTVKIIESFDDKRIRLIRSEHKGFIQALRVATNEARGKWLARMDSDDLSSHDRLEKQLHFLDEHPECVLVTTFYGIVTLHDKFLSPARSSGWNYLTPKDITLSSKPFCDPGTMFDRGLALEIGYDDQFDWEKTLWYELLKKSKGAVMEEPLYFVRWRMGSVSRGQANYAQNMSYEIQRKYDPQNALEPRTSATNKIAITGEKKCVYFYSVAGDLKAARKIAFETWRRFPFHLNAIKLVLISLGIRRPKEAFGPAGVKLFPTKSPLKRY